jgi:hypothetical protein
MLERKLPLKKKTLILIKMLTWCIIRSRKGMRLTCPPLKWRWCSRNLGIFMYVEIIQSVFILNTSSLKPMTLIHHVVTYKMWSTGCIKSNHFGLNNAKYLLLTNHNDWNALKLNVYLCLWRVKNNINYTSSQGNVLQIKM